MTERSTLSSPQRASTAVPSPPPGGFPLSTARAWVLLVLLFLAVYAGALFTPSLLDDADATHANAAQHMARTGDWVTLFVNGVRYLEKPPLPYWLAAINYHLFGYNVFSTHLAQNLAVFACAALGWLWGRRAWGDRAGFYTAAALLTTTGVFLFTRLFIPESILAFLLLFALYTFLSTLEDRQPFRILLCAASLGFAVLAKGLIAPVFFVAAVVPYLIVTREWRRCRDLPWLWALGLFLLIAAPWHILAALHNPDQGHPHGNVPSAGNVHGFLYFYFVNEHFLRFLGLRYPHDYNKQPGWIFWAGHVAWLFPWSLFFPVTLMRSWRNRFVLWGDLRHNSRNTLHFLTPRASALDAARLASRVRFRSRSGLLLAAFALFILLFFSLSTNQEYYTWPAYPALLLLTAGALARLEEEGSDRRSKVVLAAHALLAVAGVGIALALGWGLWASRSLPFVPDVGTVLAHRAVGNYSLSMSHFFDLTGPSFAALRLPAALAAVAFLLGPLLALRFRQRGYGFQATASIALTAATFLVAAHIALVRFQPLLSSRAMADTINSISGPGPGLGLPGSHPGADGVELIVYGDQANFSSVLFYTGRQALLVDGRSTSMIWGSFYPDVPHLFIEDRDLLSQWGQGAARHYLLVPPEARTHVEQVLAGRLVLLKEVSDRVLYTDRPV